MLLASAMSCQNPLPDQDEMSFAEIMSFSLFSDGKLIKLKEAANEDSLSKTNHKWMEKQQRNNCQYHNLSDNTVITEMN